MAGGLLAGRSATFSVGLARADVTPREPIRLTGYAVRTEPTGEVAQKLWIKAIAFGREDEAPCVLVSIDNCGLSEGSYRLVRDRLRERHGLEGSRLALALSHTHTGPCTRDWAPNIFARDIPAPQQEAIARYTDFLVTEIVRVVGEAMSHRVRSRLSWSRGQLEFARNRRTAGGPVDHALPVLKVESEDGSVRALVATYACHCTTLGGEFNQVCGDWAGYAQESLERRFPGALAMVTVGCGADANPHPRGGADGGLALAAQHGEALAEEVARMTQQEFAPLSPALEARMKEITLPFQKPFTREEWEARAGQEGIVGYHARKNLARLDRRESPQDTLYYPVVTWSFGEDLTWVFLPGEVVVDYALALRRRLDPQRLCVTAYANYVPCYIPSRRILEEGGYEAESSLWYYDRPNRLAPETEDLILDTVMELAPESFHWDDDRAEHPFPLEPEEAVRSLRVRAGLKVELMTSEPLVSSPVAMDWGADGRIWVCEMFDYPTGLNGTFQSGGRVKVLSDQDGDGRPDTAVTFLDGLPFPTGVTPWGRGAFICAAPDILYAEDRDGDGKADFVATNATGFATHNFQARVNGFTWGLDGWWHGSSGLFGGSITNRWTGERVELTGRDFRISPWNEGQLEPLAGVSQMGRVRDDFGTWYGNDNSNLLWQYPWDDRYVRMNPSVTITGARFAVAQGADPHRLFPVSRILTRFNDPSMAGRVTSACGPGLYRDVALGTEYAGNAFVCEPVHNLVSRLRLTREGVLTTGTRAPGEERHEFLASSDPWFRPVQVRTGPDGALWVVDMYRFVIEHPRWISQDRLAKLDVREGADRGRLYRIAPKHGSLRPTEDLTAWSTLELAKALDTPNGPKRDLIHARILACKDAMEPKVLEILRQLSATSDRPEVRAQALHVLSQLSSLDALTLRTSLNDPNPQVVIAALRVAEGQWLSRLSAKERTALAVHPDQGIRFQLALSLSAEFGPAKVGVLEALCGGGDPWVRQAAEIASFDVPVDLLERVWVWPPETPGKADLARSLIQIAGRHSDRAISVRLIGFLARVLPLPSIEEQMSMLSTLAESLERAGRALESDAELAELGGEPARHLSRLMAEGKALAFADEVSLPLRLQALDLWAWSPELESKEIGALCWLAMNAESSGLSVKAREALVRHDQEEVAEEILRHWPKASPGVRGPLLDAMTSQSAWGPPLVQSLELGTVRSTELSLEQRGRLMRHPNPLVREQARRLWPEDRTEAPGSDLKRFEGVGALDGYADRGAVHFEQLCSPCHAWRGVGWNVGPSLSEYAGKEVADYVQAILTPNSALNPNYLAYEVATQDGQVRSGLIRDETAAGLLLLQAGGVQALISRQEIKSITASPISLMPEGLAEQLAPQDVADLIAWLRSGSN